MAGRNLKSWPLAVGHGFAHFTSTGTFALDSANDKVSWYLQPEVDITITHVGFDTSGLTGTSPTYKISLQTPSGNGPDGTVLGGGTPASVSTQLSSNFTWYALDNSYAATRGEYLAIVVEYGSGTIDASNHIDVIYLEYAYGGAGGRAQAFPRASTSTDGGTSWSLATALGRVALKNSDASLVIGQATDSSSSSANIDSTNEVGNLFNVPSELMRRFEVVGVEVLMNVTQTGTDDVYFTLYEDIDTTPVILQQVKFDVENAATSASRSPFIIIFDEGTLSVLKGGTDYVIAVATNGTDAAGVNRVDFEGADERDNTQWGNSGWVKYVSRTVTTLTAPGDLAGQGAFSVSSNQVANVIPMVQVVTPPAVRLIR